MKTEKDIAREEVIKINRVHGGLMGYLNSLKLQLSQTKRDMSGENDAETEERLIALAEEYETKIQRVRVLMTAGN